MTKPKSPINPNCRVRSAVFAVSLLTLFGAAAANAAAPPLGSRSFLRRHVSSVQDLCDELDRDPRLLRIYSELLHMTPDQVKSEFAHLKMVKLHEEGVYKIYGARITPDGGKYSYKVRRLPRGSAIFTLDDGTTPVILRQCGNLLRGYYMMPNAVAKSVPRFNVINPDAGLPAAPGPAPAAVTLDSPISGEWDWVEDTNATAPPPAYIAPPVLAAATSPLWWPWLFPLVGIPFLGGGGRATTVPNTPNTPITPVIPSTPTTPGVPVVPTTPEVPTVPIVPITPEVPVVPIVPTTPEIPIVPIIPTGDVVPEPGIWVWPTAASTLACVVLLRRGRRRAAGRKRIS